MVAQTRQRILVKEPLAVERDAAEHAVVQCAFHHVRVTAIAIELEQAMVPKDQADRGAGFGIRRFVGQVIVGRETFVVRTRGRCRR